MTDENQNQSTTTPTITYKQLAEIYGYDPATVSREWKTKGLDINLPAQEIFKWVTENILKPMRNNTDLKELQALENIRLTKAKADQAELEAAVLCESLISTEYVEQTLTAYFTQLKNSLRAIANTSYLELFSSEDAIELRDKLKMRIDLVLTDIGNQKYELNELEEEEDTQGTHKDTHDDTNEQQEEDDRSTQ